MFRQYTYFYLRGDIFFLFIGGGCEHDNKILSQHHAKNQDSCM